MLQAHVVRIVLVSWAVLAALELLFFVAARKIRCKRDLTALALPIAPRPGSTITLGGRMFRRPLHTSNAQDDYLIRVMRAAGIAEPNLMPGEAPDTYVERLFAELHEKHAHYGLLAAALIPDGGQRWDEAQASEVAEFLSQLEEPADKAMYYALLGEVLRPFCMSGLGSWLGSRTSGNPITAATTSASATSPALTKATGRE